MLEENGFKTSDNESMGMLFTVDDEGKIEGNDWKAAKEWNKLSELEFRTVVFIWDNQSMYRRMSLEIREQRVAKAYLGETWGKFIGSSKYKEAQYLYRAFDFDIDMHMLELYTTKLVAQSLILAQLETSDDPVVQKKYDSVNKNVAQIMKLKADFEGKIDQRGKVNKNFKMVMSGYEKFQERAKQFKTEHQLFKNLKEH